MIRSTNIWDDVRGENEAEKESASEQSSDRFRTSVRRGSCPDTKEEEKSRHATRHGISMKSLMKNR